MAMNGLLEGLSAPALDRMLLFTAARHRVITENIANADTPGYRTRRLDPAVFQAALKKAMEARDLRGGPLRLERTRQFHETRSGRFVATPRLEPPQNLLFHDGTNTRIEQQMSDLAANTMAHQLSVELLNEHYGRLRRAISGRPE
jgi:flagellar basal-body rod protein FlgB